MRSVLLAFIFTGSSLLRAAVPAPEALFPAGGRVGTTVSLRVEGKLDPWPAGVWTDHAGLAFKATTNNGTYSVTIAAEVPPGPHLVRFFSSDGAGEPRTFVVGTREEILEREPNDNVTNAQVIEPSAVVVNGRLEKAGDVDSFIVTASAGQVLVAAVDCYALGASVDPVLQILDERGARVALNHDTHNLDPFLAWPVPRAGKYIVQLFGFAHPPAADVALKGSAAYVYRLTLTTGPYVRGTFPAGLQRGQPTTVNYFGWNLPKNSSTQRIENARASAADALLFQPAALTGDTLWLGVGDAPDVLESEPNDTPAQAQRVTFPATINGRIGQAGDVDRFAFAAKRNERFNFRLRATELHSALAGRLRVEDTNGVTLVQQESGDGSDPKLGWNAPNDGTFVVAVSDMYGSGGDAFFYRLEHVAPPPHFTATIPTHAYFLENGKTNEIKVTVTRVEGFKDKLAVSVKGLPDGVTAKLPEPTDKVGELKVELNASAEAKPASVPIEILVSAPEVRPPLSRAATYSLRGTEPRGDRLINEGHVAWLTVANKPAPPPPPKKKK